MTLPLRTDEFGFRLRGEAVTRLETFIDAAFAFAVTLLVVVVGNVPHTVAELTRALLGVPAFAGSFALVAMYWSAHDRFSRRFGLDTAGTRALGLALVFVLLVYVYPLRVVITLGAHYFSGRWLPSDFNVTTVEELEIAFIVYGVGAIALSGILIALNRIALRATIAPPLDARERLETRFVIRRFAVSIAISAASIAAALFELVAPSADWRAGLPGMLYAAFGVAMPWMHRRMRRERAALLASGATASP